MSDRAMVAHLERTAMSQLRSRVEADMWQVRGLDASYALQGRGRVAHVFHDGRVEEALRLVEYDTREGGEECRLNY